MPHVKIDQTTVLTTLCPADKRKETLFDTTISGFCCEIRPNGGRTYALRYRDEHGRQRQFRIGDASIITAAEARKQAARIKARTAVGNNPQEERKEKRSIPTVAELSTRYLEYVRSYKRAPDIDERALRLHILPRFGRKHLDQLDQTEIMEWLAGKVTDGLAQATANRLQVILGHMMRMAKKWGLPGADRNPLEGARLKEPNNGVERFLSPAETIRLRDAVDASPNRMLAPIVALLLLTGCRKRELLDATWDQFDIDRRSWRIPLTKTGKARHVPLSDDALAVLEYLPRFENCRYVVPNPKTKKPFTSIYNSWDSARRAARVSDVRVHDLRHSAASNMVNSGQSLYIVGQVLGHAQAKTTARYAHLSSETLLNAVNAASQQSGTTWAKPSA